MRRATSILVLSLVIPLPLNADEPRGVPHELFDIKLGGVYSLGSGERDDVGTLPIKELGGIQRFLGSGVNYYFRPLLEISEFEYVEDRKEENQYFKTSYRLYLLPVIPDSITTVDELESANIQWEVSNIEWNIFLTDNNNDETRQAYYWAQNMCKSVQIDLGVEPDITDYYEHDWYTCRFVDGNREFEVSSMNGKEIELSYVQEYWDTRNDAVDAKLRKLNMESIRPY